MPWRQGAGFLLLCMLLLAGHVIRDRLLTYPDGSWRAELQRLPWDPPAADGDPVARDPEPTLSIPLAINTAPRDSLILLPGVGPVLAGRILAARSRGTVFTCASDLVRIKGIGPRLAARLDTLLAFAGPPGPGTMTVLRRTKP